jgi:hypothetical protein
MKAVFAACLLAAGSWTGCGRPHTTGADVAASPPARFALGAAAPSLITPLSPDERSRIAHSYLARRSVAWEIVSGITQKIPTPHGQGSVERWMTWYGRDDFQRMFASGFSGLPLEQRQLLADITDEHARRSEQELAVQLIREPSWTAARRQAFLGSLKEDRDWTGLVGLGRVIFSAESARHMMMSYQDLMACSAGNPNTCVREFPSDAVILKPVWVRSELGFGIPTFDTSASALTLRLANGGRSWDDADRMLPSIGGRALEQRTQAGGIFQLAGLHIMSKVSQDWLWITLWWSDDPHSDFGEDRPEVLANTPWSNYKMCVVSEFDEKARDLDLVRDRHPSLGAALAVAQDESGLSWCSNPYLEKGDGNQRTNCIGCHQHAGDSTITPEGVLKLDSHGRDLMREAFPADYVWSLAFGPESVARQIGEQVRYFSGP